MQRNHSPSLIFGILGGRVGGCHWRVRPRFSFFLPKFFLDSWSILHNSRHLWLACVHRWRFTSSPSVEERDFFLPQFGKTSLGQYSSISGDGRVAILHLTTRLPLLCGSLRELSNAFLLDSNTWIKNTQNSDKLSMIIHSGGKWINLLR